MPAKSKAAAATRTTIAYLREHGEYLNAILAEQPNGDFGQTIVRQVLIDAFQLELYERMTTSTDERLAAIAAKSVKEVRYHLRYSSGWLVRLGDGTEESHARVQSALERLWPYTVELFAEDELDRLMADQGVAPRIAEVQAAWSARIDADSGRGDAQPPQGSPAFLAWQARSAQRASRLHTRRDAAFAARLSGSTLVNCARRAADARTGAAAGLGCPGGGRRSRDPGLEHRRSRLDSRRHAALRRYPRGGTLAHLRGLPGDRGDSPLRGRRARAAPGSAASW